ncbi:MAG: phosphoenolpyruvate--protein phosphotransferase [Candidatus Coatesbacteria bacterium]|nr:MAG: phosphoenolpyruvate--protein phosphotransferase [Candidatus Coatesbacteria bacterium]
MYVFQGIPASPGIAVGKTFIVHLDELDVAETLVDEKDVEAEVARFRDALKVTKSEFEVMRERLAGPSETVSRELLDAYILLLDDIVLVKQAEQHIRDRYYSAEYAVKSTLEWALEIFDDMEDPYFRERAVDLKDVGSRIIQNLLGTVHVSYDEMKDDSVVVAHELPPSETASIPRSRVAGFVTEVGSRTSHTAIMARSIEVPAVVGASGVTGRIRSGDVVALDGFTGRVVVNPDAETLAEFEERRRAHEKELERKTALAELPAKTIDGYRIELSANIEVPEELDALTRYGADGIGLYRTEFLFMNRDDVPSEDEQFEVYREVAEAALPHSTIIRTIDIGGDKFLTQLNISAELNPYLGLRAIRFCLERPEVFLTQLRAILRASAYGKIKVMFPMISDLSELVAGKEWVARAMEELKSEGKPFNPKIEVGIMIEVPSAAVTADVLARHCDFFSIGTNDLIQYTIAVERGNEKIAYLYQPFHPAVIRLIYAASDAAHKNGIWIGVCGEIVTLSAAVVLLLGLSFDEFSASPIAIPDIKETIRRIRYSDARVIAEEAINKATTEELVEYMETEMARIGLEKEIGWMGNEVH